MRRTTLALCLLSLLPLTRLSQAELKEPTVRDRLISRRIAELLEGDHISGAKLDDTASRRFFDSYIGTLDPVRVYFYRADIEEFESQRDALDDKLRAGELDFAHLVYTRFLERLTEAEARLVRILAEDLDFSVEEFIESDRKKSKFVGGEEEMDALWRKRIKLLILQRIVNVEDPDSAEAEQKARENVARMHRNFFLRMKQADNSEVLQTYLSAASTTFDPHTSYLSHETLENFRISFKLELDGIGAALSSDDGFTIITSIVPGGAAAADGRLRENDKILAIAQGKDGEFVDAENVRLNEVVHQIRGKRGTTVRLRVEHGDGSGEEVIDIVRAKIKLQDRQASGEILEVAGDGDTPAVRVGVVDLPSFYRDLTPGGAARDRKIKSTTTDVERILQGFRKDGVDVVLVDLRRNGGGVLKESIDMTGLFIDQGPVVQVKRPGGRTVVHKDERAGVAWDGPVVVLTSRHSASASEIFAGALQDYGRALVVGDRSTHGKGTVQELRPLGGRRSGKQFQLGAIKITVSQFYRPSGDSTQNLGVVPHIELPAIASHLDIGEGHLDYALEFDRVRRVEFDSVDVVPEKLVEHLTLRSKKRVAESEPFGRVENDIARFLKIKTRRVTPLQKAKFFSEQRRESIDRATFEVPPGAADPQLKILQPKKVDGPDGAKVNPGKIDPAKIDPTKIDPAKLERPQTEDAGAAIVTKSAIVRDFYLEEVLAITRDYVAALAN